MTPVNHTVLHHLCPEHVEVEICVRMSWRCVTG